jgi:glycosyltransferase involved in cell wall biosynthesis
LRIAYFIDHLDAAGAQKVLLQIMTEMSGYGHEQILFSMNRRWDPVYLEKVKSLGVQTHFLGLVGILSGWGLVKTWRILQREKIELVVTWLFYGDVVGRVVGRLAGVPRVISTIRARNVFYKPWQFWLARATVSLADQVVLNSHHLREFAHQGEGVPIEKMVVIHNGITPPEKTDPAARAALFQEYQLPTDNFILGSVGRLRHQKGFDILLTALTSLTDLNLILLIAGDGPDREALEKQAAGMGGNVKIHFIGYRPALPDFYAGLDLYVHPARFEGMPNAVMEAMAAGCPIVATAVDGTNELIMDGEQGWLVAPEDPDALAGAIRDALADESEASKRGVAAKTRIVESFGQADKLTEWRRLLESGQEPS